MVLGPLLALLVVSFLLVDLFRGGSTTKDKILVVVLFLILLAFAVWFYARWGIPS